MPDEEPHPRRPNDHKHLQGEALEDQLGATNYNHMVNEQEERETERREQPLSRLSPAPAPATARIRQVDGTARGTPARVIHLSASGSLSRSEPSAGPMTTKMATTMTDH